MKRISFKSFLSHRYKSAEINIYFFKLFKEVAEVQFEIDVGTFNTNVTRLERMVRDADAFIGIYPFGGTAEEGKNPDELKKQSRYFRLEIDLAIRSQKPAIIFYDKRYGSLIKPPENIFSYPYDEFEITSEGGYPSYNKHKREFVNFCDSVFRKKSYDDVQNAKQKSTVALIVSSNTKNKDLELNNFKERIRKTLEGYNYFEMEVINTPITLDIKLFRIIEKIDFAIVDHSLMSALNGLPSFLHGRFIPMIRLQKIENIADQDNLELHKFLFGGLEVGYEKDLIKWDNEESLIIGIKEKLGIINSDFRRINTFEEASNYFMSAVLRKEVVFVSYSGKDVEIAKEIINNLKKYYQTVFDYRDGQSIEPGQPWLSEIFNTLALSAIGINLLSSSYLQSGNCIHEAQQMVANLDSGKIKLFPIKLYSEQIELPAFFGMTQYLRRLDYIDTKDLIKDIVRLSSNAIK